MYAPYGESLPVIGDGKVFGITTGSVNGGMLGASIGGAGFALAPSQNYYGINVGETRSITPQFSQALGVGLTDNGEKSGIVCYLKTKSTNMIIKY